jgi:hypothetical protein
MDPYLEGRWSDVHSTLITAVREALQPSLPAGLRARSEERVLLEEEQSGETIRGYRADVAVVESAERVGRSSAAVGTLKPPEPVMIKMSEPVIDRFIQIIDVSNDNRVVTAIEVLSPWNKMKGRLNDAYRRKLDDYMRASVNVVEIDLLRSSRGYLLVTQADLPARVARPYLITVHRTFDPGTWALYGFGLREPIPPIYVPLRPTDEPVVLHLQPLIERVYVGGGHDDIDYSKPPVPPLEGEDVAWADELLRGAGRR